MRLGSGRESLCGRATWSNWPRDAHLGGLLSPGTQREWYNCVCEKVPKAALSNAGRIPVNGIGQKFRERRELWEREFGRTSELRRHFFPRSQNDVTIETISESSQVRTETSSDERTFSGDGQDLCVGNTGVLVGYQLFQGSFANLSPSRPTCPIFAVSTHLQGCYGPFYGFFFSFYSSTQSNFNLSNIYQKKYKLQKEVHLVLKKSCLSSPFWLQELEDS